MKCEICLKKRCRKLIYTKNKLYSYDNRRINRYYTNGT